jgi:hypothetical protein
MMTCFRTVSSAGCVVAPKALASLPARICRHTREAAIKENLIDIGL